MLPYTLNIPNIPQNAVQSGNTLSSNQSTDISISTNAIFQILSKLDTLNTNVQQLGNRLSQVEQRQSQLEELISSQLLHKPEVSGSQQTKSVNSSSQSSNTKNSEPNDILPVSTFTMAPVATAQIAGTSVNNNKRLIENLEEASSSHKKQAIDVNRSKEVSFQQLIINPKTSPELIEKYKADTISTSEVHVINENTRILDENGKILVIFIKQIDYEKFLPSILQLMKSSACLRNTRRGDAGGKFDASTLGKKQGDFTVQKNKIKAMLPGKPYKYANSHMSSTLGYASHNKTKLPCRESAQNDSLRFNDIIPFVEEISALYAAHAPKNYALQLKAFEDHKVDAQKDHLVHCQIKNTPFTNLTINHSTDGRPTTFFHKDKNAFKGGLACMFVYGNNYSGGETAFPELLHSDNRPIAFDVRPGGLLMFDGVELLHGNTPVKMSKDGNRVSFVAYAQKIFTDCMNLKCKLEDSIKPNPSDE